MMDAWLALALKAATVASAVVFASAIAERTKPAIAAMILALPVSAGPGYILLALQHDAHFLAQASLSGLPINLSTAVLVLAYAHFVRRGYDVVPALTFGVVLWFLTTLVLRALPTSFASAMLLLALFYPLILWASWGWRRGPGLQPVRRRWYDLPLRAGLVAAIVVTIVSVSDIIGPIATGSAILFPTTYISFILLMHRRLGGALVASAMVQSLFMLIGFILGVTALHVCARSDRVAEGLTLLFVVPAAFALAVLGWRHWRAKWRAESLS